MMRFRLWIIIFFLLPGTLPAMEPHLTVLSDERQPLAWTSKGGPRGIAYDLVAATMRELGMAPDIQFTTFSRGLTLAQTEPNHAFFSVTRRNSSPRNRVANS